MPRAGWGSPATPSMRCGARDAAFATRWQDAVDRAAASREGARQPHSALQYDNRLLQFLLGAHRPDVYRY